MQGHGSNGYEGNGRMSDEDLDENDLILVRNYRLGVAWSRGTTTELDRVTFDFRCDLDTAVWRPVSFFGAFVYGDGPGEPRLRFPWSPLIHVDDGSDDSFLEVEPGDTVWISRIETRPVQSRLGDLDAFENRVRQLAWLSVTSPDGAVRPAPLPLELFAETGTALQIELKDYQAAHRGLAAKLADVVGVEDLDDVLDLPRSEWLAPDKIVPPAYAEALDALITASETMDDGAFVAFGYMMARAEAEANLLVAANRGRRAVDIQALGAEGRRKQSRARTEPLRAAARKVINEEPDISLSACARRVETLMSEEPSWTFKSDDKWIANHIRELFERRENGREYRPIRSA